MQYKYKTQLHIALARMTIT